jgi:hypothetical protein
MRTLHQENGKDLEVRELWASRRSSPQEKMTNYLTCICNVASGVPVSGMVTKGAADNRRSFPLLSPA